MKKLLATIAILGTLTLLGSPMAQAASAKAGAACSKAGSTQVVSGKKFTCVKSGKKLVWNKGVAIVAKPTPTETAPLITLDNLDASWTSKVALAKVNEKLSTLAQSSLQPEIIASPTTKPAEKELELKLLQPVMRLFQQYFSPAKFQVVMFTNEDADWARNALRTYGGSFPNDIGDEIAKRSSGYSRCNFAFATRTASGTPIYYECTDTRQIRNEYNYQNPPHEYFHLVHQYLAPVQLPVWLTEGSASFFGEMIGYSNFSNPVPRKLQQGFNTGHDFDPDNAGFDPNRFEKWLPTATSADVAKVLKVLETEPARARRYYAEYALGSWATEALVAVYGVDGFMKIWQNVGSGQNFESAFKSAFGLTPDEFYVKLTPYLNSRKNPKIN
jgi:uncharacterized protein with PIN domain